MNSEKVKEIKRTLEYCKHRMCEFCPRLREEPPQEDDCRLDVIDKALILINELESENERLKIVVDIANERAYRKKFIDEWRKEYRKELDKQGNGHIAGFPDFDLVYKLYFEQKDRIAELEKEIQQLKKDRNENKRLRAKLGQVKCNANKESCCGYSNGKCVSIENCMHKDD